MTTSVNATWTLEQKTPKTDGLGGRTQTVPLDPDAIVTRRSVFDDPDLAPHYWPKKEYENLHRFDPTARWTYREEKEGTGPQVGLEDYAYGSYRIFRLELGQEQANSDSFLQDLGLTADGNALQRGYIPDLILYLSYFYTKTELPMRLALFWMSLNFCGIVASFLASGTLHMDGVAGAAGWRGLLTLLIGFFSFFNMPPSPTQTKTWFRPNGWFTEREEIIIVNRVLLDDPTKGDMHNREGLTLRRLWTAVCDYDLWPIYTLYVVPVSMIEDVWTLPFLVALYALPSNPNPWIFFAVVNGLLSHPYTHAIQVAWCSRNGGAVASRTVNASLYNMFVQASGIISAQIYVASEAPRYQCGNMILIIICIVNICILYPGTKAYYIWRNRQRAKIWDVMTTEERVSP
ncbi:hypothetical protein F4604DRAFT_1959400 [Suillus subluteus]|nr:hypothetical protein F4604DRAFT_1959400 [Suillus subluteus]